MFDCQNLRKYNVTLGQTIQLEVWDGWNDFLKVSVMGFASKVLPSLSQNETEAKYQLKVALHMAAFFGHVDLAVTLLKIGVRPDEPVGYHPKRMWCTPDEAHIDSLVTPIHIAVARGNLNVIRPIVHHDIASVLARDGHNRTPLQAALKMNQKACASFLITQQWKEIPFNHKTSIPLSIYAKMKSWCERARYRAPTTYNPMKFHHRRHLRPIQSLVGNGVLVDGFSESKMKSKSTAQMRQEINTTQTDMCLNISYLKHQEKELDDMEPEQYFKLITSVPSFRLPQVGSNRLKSKKSAHFETILNLNDSSQTQGVFRRNTDGALKLPSIADSDHEQATFGKLSRSVEHLGAITEASKGDVIKFTRGRQSMPHLRCYHATDDDIFHSAKKVSRSHSVFADVLRLVCFYHLVMVPTFSG